MIKGVSIGTGTFTIKGTSTEFADNKATQEITVNVVAALDITTTALTFYQNVAGSEAYVSSSNDDLATQQNKTGNVVYSANNLPAGLHMDAGGNGLIYGKATTVGTTPVEVTATNIVTKVSVKEDVTVTVLEDPFDFTLTADGTDVKLNTTDEKYYVIDSNSTYNFTANKPFVAGEWTIKASGDFNEIINFTASGDASVTTLTFTPITSGEKFALSGDYVVVVTHKVLDTTTVATDDYRSTEQSVVMHFQAGLKFDTLPEASMNVSYTGLGVVAVA